MKSLRAYPLRPVCWLALICLLAAALPASVSFSESVETWSVDRRCSHPGTIKVTDADAGAAVVEIDLSALPKGAKVHRARLLVQREPVDGSDEEAMIPCQVFPLRARYRPGEKPDLADRPLAIPPPWHDHFDATEIVSQWVAGGHSNYGLYVKYLPKWQQDATRLEIAYEAPGGREPGLPRRRPGEPGGKLPTQVSGLKVLHRAGQTFITWREIEEAFGKRPVTWAELRQRLAKMDDERIVRYRVYRHIKPIDKDSIAEAQLLAEVRPLSGFNVNSWSKERLINQTVFGNEDKGELGKYGPFSGWDRDSAPGGRLVIPRFVIDEKAGPLPPGAGLYVQSFLPAAGGQALAKVAMSYYAVVASVNGTANTAEFSPANSLARPVAESQGPWEPVAQNAGDGGFGFDFPGRKLYYVRWVGPPLSNLPSRYFNWSVHVPAKLSGPAPLNVSFHDQGFSYAKPIRRFDRSAIQLAGHDFGPVSGWYGYHECLGTLRSWQEGKVQPYTERRLLAMIEWAKRKWTIDPRRCFTDGRGMGGTGAAHFACKHPELFAYVLCDGGAVTCADSNDLPALESAWGRVEWGLPNDQDVKVWDWQDLTWFVGTKGPAWALPVLSFSPVGHTAWREVYPRRVVSDRNARWMRSHRDFTRLFKALTDNKHMFFADFDWGPTLAILPQWMDVTRGPVPAVTNSSDKNIKQTEDGPFIFFEPSGSSPSGWIHWHHRWQSAGAVDEPERLEMTLYVTGGEVTADVTPRRMERFRPRPGETFRWTNTCLAEGEKTWELREVWKKYPQRKEIQSSTVTADRHGLITLEGVIILPTRSRIVVQRQEATQ